MTTALRGRPGGPPVADPWHALWAMMVGFFMILVDATIVSVANPSIMAALGTGYDAVIWVTSAYLLGFAVPLLLAGRLGDRYGPKNLYLIGLAGLHRRIAVVWPVRNASACSSRPAWCRASARRCSPRRHCPRSPASSPPSGAASR